MGFIKLNCPTCGAAMDLDENREFGFCSYCGTKVVQDKIVIEHKGTVSISGIANEKSILKRMFMFLEDKDWDNADIYADKVLDINPQNSYAYIGKLMSSLKVNKFENLQYCSEAFDKNGNYIKAVQFGDKSLIDTLQNYTDIIKSRLKQEKTERIYQSAIEDAKTADNYALYEAVSKKFATLGDYKESINLSIKYNQMALNLQETAKKQKEKKKKIITTSFIFLAISIIILIVANQWVIKPYKYKKGLCLIEENNYSEAAEIFESLKNYKNSQEMFSLSEYNYAKELIKADKRIDALNVLFAIDEYKDCSQIIRDQLSKNAEHKTISAGFNHTVALLNNGTAIATGDNTYGQCNVGGWKNIIAVSAGANYTLGLTKSGTVLATGLNTDKRCNVSAWKDIIAISAGSCYSIGLKADGTVVATGNNDYNQCDITTWQKIIYISAGDVRTFGIKSDGTVLSTPENSFLKGKTDDWKNIIKICSGDYQAVGLSANGTVITIGHDENKNFDTENWTNIVNISASENIMGLKKDGTVLATGFSTYGQNNVKSFKNVIDISSGGSHSIVLDINGRVYATGDNRYGQCNVSEWEDIMIPNNN